LIKFIFIPTQVRFSQRFSLKILEFKYSTIGYMAITIYSVCSSVFGLYGILFGMRSTGFLGRLPDSGNSTVNWYHGPNNFKDTNP
jgi:hypothetical protein